MELRAQNLLHHLLLLHPLRHAASIRTNTRARKGLEARRLVPRAVTSICPYRDVHLRQEWPPWASKDARGLFANFGVGLRAATVAAVAPDHGANRY